MADAPIEVTGQVFEVFPKLDERARAQLRGQIPVLTKKLAERVRQKLQPGVLFKTTNRLLPAVRSEMVENTTQVYGRVYIDQRKFPNVVAHTLESGSRAHEIVAKNASALFFFWGKLGKNVAFRRVHHPGFSGRSYMESSLNELRGQFVAELRESMAKSMGGK